MMVLGGTFGDELRRAREHAGLSQRAVGDILGVSGSAIGEYERGASQPMRSKVSALEDAVGLPRGHLASLLGEEPMLADQVRELRERLDRIEAQLRRLLP
jgi:transcriptional regulator with XRE-family HTH domain